MFVFVQTFMYLQMVYAYAMSEQLSGQMPRTRALITETEREYIAHERSENKENLRYQAISRVRDRLEGLEKDIEVLEEHHPELLAEIREIVCTETEDADTIEYVCPECHRVIGTADGDTKLCGKCNVEWPLDDLLTREDIQ